MAATPIFLKESPREGIRNSIMKGADRMSDYILEMNHITKEFPGSKALDDVNFQVERGLK